MRIIKDCDNYITIIAGEMLNIEMSVLAFIDGVLQDQIIKGYPTIKDKGVSYTFRAVQGIILVPIDCDYTRLEKRLIVARGILEQQYRDKFGTDDHLHAPQTFIQGSATNLQVASSQKMILGSEKLLTMRYGKPVENCKIAFVKAGLSQRGRFTWMFQHIDSFPFGTIHSNAAEYAISHHICSIFYDKKDVCALEHNAITFTFSRADFRLSVNIMHHSLTILHCKMPGAIAFSDYWKTMYNVLKPKFRNLKCDVWAADWAQVLEPETLCVRCRSILWGDIYVVGDATDGKISGYLICAICLHTNLHIVERKQKRVFRITHPNTVETMCEDASICDIINEANRGIIKHYDTNNHWSHINLGHKYVIPHSIDTHLCNSDIRSSNKILPAITIIEPLSQVG